jgi:hypothetical protein
MTNQEILDAIFHLAPGAQFSFTEADLSTLVWDSKDIKQPTVAEIMAAIPMAKAAKEAEAESKAAAKASLLNRLGMTPDEAALLLG